MDGGGGGGGGHYTGRYMTSCTDARTRITVPSRDGSPRRYARANRNGGRPCRSVRRPVPHRRVHPPTSCRRALAFAARGLRIAAAAVRGTQVSGGSCRRRRCFPAPSVFFFIARADARGLRYACARSGFLFPNFPLFFLPTKTNTTFSQYIIPCKL